MNALLHESDACLELLEQAILADLRRVPRALRDRVARLARAAGHRRSRPPLDPLKAHEFVFEVQGERLLAGAPAEAPEVPRKPKRAPKPRRAPRTWQPGPVFGSLEWLETRRPTCPVADPEWAWEVWREAADLARLHPTPGRAAAMQDAWAYYWTLLDGQQQPAESARRAA
ncbi:MAG TPA: hypothetical protein VOB72_04735 [Candidatus Dormibacteraeota bacterium]|nr:hypothetical protein [Candidatus Dormibacteraeota bacterium]